MIWKLFKFKSGSNPYIATNEKEVARLLKKYNGKIKKYNNDIYIVDDLGGKK